MDPIFSQTQYALKRQGLAIGGKYRLFDLQGKEPLLFIEEKTKWLASSTTIHVYADEKKTREILTLKDRPSGSAEDMDVFDAETGQKIGSLVMDAQSISEIFKDVWEMRDADDKPVGRIYEKQLAKSLARDLISHSLPTKLDVSVGDVEVAELRQKLKAIGYELEIDMSKDVSGLLDHRLAIAAGIMVAVLQGRETN